MSRTTVQRTIDAPIDVVFNTVADVRNFSKVVPEIVNVQFLTDSQVGLGTRFRETRMMNGREATVELEVTEYQENDHVRIVSDAGGTIWDTVFSVKPVGDQVELDMTMDANAYKLLAKLFNPFIKGVIQKAVERDMDAVKKHCEERG